MEIKKIEDIYDYLGILWEYDKDHQRINFPKDSPNYEEFKKNMIKEYEEEPDGFFLIYENEVPIGFLKLKVKYNPFREQKYGDVRCIHLDTIYRGKGYGTKLLEFVDEYFKKNGCKYAFAGISAFNQGSNFLFKNRGYTETRIILEKEY